MNKLTIAILTLNRLEHLKFHLDHIEDLFAHLPKKYKNRLNVFISDNCSDDKTRKFLSDYAKKRNWIDYFFHERRVLYDKNVLTPYLNASGDYIWFLAVDDIIPKTSYLVSILNLLDTHNPSGINFPTSSLANDFNDSISEKNIVSVNLLCNTIKIIQLGGKLSSNIIKRIRLNRDDEIYQFVGVSYMHLSLQAWVNLVYQKKGFIRIKQALVLTDQKFGDKNNYHPKFACFVKEGLAFKELQRRCPTDFVELYKPGIRELKFLVNQIRYRTLDSWHVDMLQEFIYNTFFEILNNKFSLYRMALSILVLLGLLGKPLLLKTALRGIASKSKLNEAPIDRF